MNQVYCGCGVYHIYISLLKAYEDQRQGRKSLLVIINDRTEGITGLIPRLKALNLFEDVVSVKSYVMFEGLKKKIGWNNYLWNRGPAIAEYFETLNPHILDYHEFISEAEINLFHVVRTRAYFLIKYPDNNFRMMEEGTGTYIETMPIMRYIKRKYIMKFPLLMGYDKNTSEVVVQFPEKMKSKVLRNKAVKLDLFGLEEALTNNQKQDIVHVFQGEPIDLYSNAKKAIILTQPLIPIGYKIDEEGLVEIYRNFIHKAKEEGCETIFFKEHPREHINYENHFKDYPFISKLMPIEVLNLDSQIAFDWGYTISSGSIDNLKNLKNKMSLGRDYLKK